MAVCVQMSFLSHKGTEGRKIKIKEGVKCLLRSKMRCKVIKAEGKMDV